MLLQLQVQLLPGDHDAPAGQGHAWVGADARCVDDDLAAQRLAGRGENPGDHIERLHVLLLVGHPHGGEPAAGQRREARLVLVAPREIIQPERPGHGRAVRGDDPGRDTLDASVLEVVGPRQHRVAVLQNSE